MKNVVPRDTIVAVATPPGRGGIGIVRVSGPLARSIGATVTGTELAPRRATHAAFRDAAGEIVDEGIAIYFKFPHSYTGEEVLELQGHGGPAVLERLLEVCTERGARIAEPGEFTRRAFLNGRIDLAQAEAVADLIEASSRQAARSAARSLIGEFSDRIRGIQEKLLELRALVEAMLDFPEEEIGTLYRQDAEQRLSMLKGELDHLLSSSRQGSILRNGVHAVLLGRPNVGKSSLLNRLAGEERAIVTPIAGTTRDALREPLLIEGVPIVLVDTAGLREGGDEIERIGIERARREASRADIVIRVTEPGQEPPPLTEGTDVPVVDVVNKIDLLDEDARRALPADSLAVSARTGQGIDQLGERILRAVGWSGSDEPGFLARERHIRALEETMHRVEAASDYLEDWELLAEELRLAQTSLGSIIGETTADDVLGQIFSRFCIGK